MLILELLLDDWAGVRLGVTLLGCRIIDVTGLAELLLLDGLEVLNPVEGLVEREGVVTLVGVLLILGDRLTLGAEGAF